jgi:para-nitrobenzyl esterase
VEIMTGRSRRLLTVSCTVLLLTVAAAAAGALAAGPSAGGVGAPIVTVQDGAVRGAAVAGGYEFLGLPYAAPPVGKLRLRAPEPADRWHGVRDGTQFGPSCPQMPAAFPPGPQSEDCLYLNVYTPALPGRHKDRRPVLVWIHGGGLSQDAARDYDGSDLAAQGIVVVTINYRLGLLGFLAHPALASRPGGPAGNYGLMDQQAALRWVQRNIDAFGGDPHDVAIAGESCGVKKFESEEPGVLVLEADSVQTARRADLVAVPAHACRSWPARPSWP